MAKIARRVFLGWLAGAGAAVGFGYPAEAKPPLKRGTFLYSDVYTDRYNA